MPDDIDINCRHRKLKCSVTYSSERLNDDVAIVSCKFCGFTVEITDQHITDEMMRAEFNIAAAKAARGFKIFISKN